MPPHPTPSSDRFLVSTQDKNTMSVRIGYLNVRGLNVEKHEACIRLIDSGRHRWGVTLTGVGIFDILVLSETWFVRYDYMAHPYSIAQSLRPERKGNSRHTGGLLVMAKDGGLIHSVQTSRHCILMKIVGGVGVLSVYLPPSLSTHQVGVELDSFPDHRYDVIVGDINVRFVGLSKSRSTSTHEKQSFWNRWNRENGFGMAIPSEEPVRVTMEQRRTLHKGGHSLNPSTVGDRLSMCANPELDHVLRRESTEVKVQFLETKQFGIDTDHEYLIRCSFPLPEGILLQEKEKPGLGRFRLENLKKDGFRERAKRCWTHLDSEIDWDIVDVDRFDSTLCCAIQAVFDESLGTYDAIHCRKTRDVAGPRLQSELSDTAPILLFKRKQRGLKKRLTITPETEGRSAMEECSERFSRLFDNPSNVILPKVDHRDAIVDELRERVWPREIGRFIREYPKDKACGADSIHSILMSALQDTSFVVRLSDLFDLCIRAGKTPRRWNESITYLLPKTNEPPVTSDTVRPLSVLPMFRRAFESLILPTFTDERHHFARLHPCQAGFRKGYSTLTHATICHHALSTGAVSLAVFLDFRSAYDVTPAAKVIEALGRRGMSPLLQRLVHSLMFDDARLRLAVNGDLSDLITRSCGLPQGSILSPIIFDMFIDSLVRRLNIGRPDRTVPSCLFFADDGALLCEGMGEARRLLRIAEHWAKDNGMAFNVPKCGVIHRDPSAKSPLSVDGSEIPTVDTYRYLGFNVTSRGIDFAAHVVSRAEAGQAFLGFARAQCTEWVPSARRSIYNTFIRPQLEYGAPLIYAHRTIDGDKSLLRPLQDVQDRALNWILGSESKHYNVLRGILGTETVEERLRHLRAGFQRHLHETNDENPIRALIVASLPGDLLHALRSDALFDEFMSGQTGSRPLKDSLREFLLRKRRATVSNGRSILVGYVPLSARTDGLVDRVLMSPAKTQQCFVLWRIGSLFTNRKCPCGSRWLRGHIPCLYDDPLSAELREAFREAKGTMSKNFCKLDFLLNRQEWEWAARLIARWTEELKVEIPDRREVAQVVQT